MPTILKIKGYRFFFYVNDHSPPHIHVEKGYCTAKFFLEPPELIKSRKFSAVEINMIRKLIVENIDLFKSKWNEFFNNN
ncbi:MAG: DUF4160 domain-containing protein [Bacteroidetes bacterium]|nr:DUF4160 domain-containing protein [Bacteroidota bacterium]